MRKISVYTVSFLLILLLANGFAFADEERGGRKYEITITNLTRDQIFSPPIVISHNEKFTLFKLGEPAPIPLIPLAEDGMTDDLVSDIRSQPEVVFDWVPDEDRPSSPIGPGESLTLEIYTKGPFQYISAAGMLVSTNDALFAVRKIRVPQKGKVYVYAKAYDAGSEANSEKCAYIPGPPCTDGGGKRDTEGAEDYVHIHAGIHGIGDLEPADKDWRNPVAEIRIRPIYRWRHFRR